MRNITAKKWGRLIQSLISKGTEDKSSESREEQMEVINNVSKKLRDDPKEEIRSDSGLLLHSWKHRRGTNMADVDKNLESKPINSNIEMDYLNSADASAELVTNQDQIYKTIRSQIIAARHQIYSSVNASMLAVYWNAGKEIYTACGKNDRAAYGKQILQYISDKLTAEFGKGFSVRNLRNMRQFYLAFPDFQSLHSELSWSHYLLLVNVENTRIRTFYLEEAVKSGWSVRQLERQINTMFYQRLLASHDKESVSKEIQRTSPKPEYENIIRDPYVLEFLDLPPNEHYYESDLEEALITHLQKFLLELGRGFSFVARQKHFNIDGRHFYIDLVFYNYITKCFVLIDLKTGDLTHQDIGQMQMYVNYYTRHMMNEGDNPPIGILLCAQKSDTLVKLTLAEDNYQIYAAKYMPYMPTEEELKRELNLKDFEKLENNHGKDEDALDE